MYIKILKCFFNWAFNIQEKEKKKEVGEKCTYKVLMCCFLLGFEYSKKQKKKKRSRRKMYI